MNFGDRHWQSSAFGVCQAKGLSFSRIASCRNEKVFLTTGRQDAAVLGNICCGNVRQVDPDRVRRGASGPADALDYSSKHLTLLHVGPSAPNVASNPYLIRGRRLVGITG